MKAVRFVFVTLFCFFAIIYLLFVTYLYFNQESMIFQPVKLAKDYRFNYKQNFEEVNVKSFDNAILNGLLFKVPNPKGIVFFLHGNFGALDSWGTVAKNYNDLGYDIFILDYRGFGKSEGQIDSEEQFYKDLTAAYQKVTPKYNGQVVIVGYSIGTGGAAYLAANNKIKTLVLLAPYYNFTELSNSRFPFVPDFIKKYKFETNRYLSEINVPVLIFHGENDNVIPYSNSVKLSKLLKTNGHFYTLEDEDHLGLNENPEYLSVLKSALK